jgi:hypothetical protein
VEAIVDLSDNFSHWPSPTPKCGYLTRLQLKTRIHARQGINQVFKTLASVLSLLIVVA